MNDSIFPRTPIWFLDPRTKMVLILAISSVAMAGKIDGDKIYPRLVLLLVPSLLFFVNGKYQKAAGSGLIIGLGWLGEISVGHFNQSGAIIVMMAAGIITRFVAPLIMGQFFLYSTQVEELVVAFEKMAVPHQIVIPFAAMFRFFPTAKEELAAISDAMNMRQLGRGYALKHPLLFLEYRFIPLVSSMVKIANDLTISCVTRGLGGPRKRTSILHLAFTYADIIVVSIVLITVTFYVML